MMDPGKQKAIDYLSMSCIKYLKENEEIDFDLIKVDVGEALSKIPGNPYHAAVHILAEIAHVKELLEGLEWMRKMRTNKEPNNYNEKEEIDYVLHPILSIHLEIAVQIISKMAWRLLKNKGG